MAALLCVCVGGWVVEPVVQVVNEERGKEEYVHLKSLEDEFEFLESTMPKKMAPEEPPPATHSASHTPSGSRPASSHRGAPASGKDQYPYQEEEDQEAKDSYSPAGKGRGQRGGGQRGGAYVRTESDGELGSPQGISPGIW